jgi:uncharacterized phiE125 gp8 family phage protein
MSYIEVTPPQAEPVDLSELKLLLNMPLTANPLLDPSLYSFIHAARRDCESAIKRVLVTQTWQWIRDFFPGHNLRYEWNGYPEIRLGYPPLQSVVWFQYIDVAGTPQTLTRDTTFGTNPLNPEYGYQLERGSDTRPGRLLPPFARPWPPTRMVPGNVVVRFRSGYGGPITVSMTAGSAALSVAAGSQPSTFNPDDAPQIFSDLGTKISIPGAGPTVGSSATTLETSIAAVDSNGNATLADVASNAVSGVTAWLGRPVPKDLRQSILFQAQFFFEQGGVTDQPLPRVVEVLRKPYLNWET